MSSDQKETPIPPWLNELALLLEEALQPADIREYPPTPKTMTGLREAKTIPHAYVAFQDTTTVGDVTGQFIEYFESRRHKKENRGKRLVFYSHPRETLPLDAVEDYGESKNVVVRAICDYNYRLRKNVTTIDVFYDFIEEDADGGRSEEV